MCEYVTKLTDVCLIHSSRCVALSKHASTQAHNNRNIKESFHRIYYEYITEMVLCGQCAFFLVFVSAQIK